MSPSTSRTAPPVQGLPHDKLPTSIWTRHRPRDPSSGWPNWARRVSRAGCGSPRRWRHRHDVPRRASVAAGDPGAHQRLMMVAPYLARTIRSCCRWSVGAVRHTTWRCVSSKRPMGAAGRAARAMPNICLQMLLRAAIPLAIRRIRKSSRPRLSRRRRHRHRHLPDLRRAQQPRVDAPRDRCGARTGSAIAEVAMCYTGDLSDPVSAVHAGLLPEAGEQIVDAGAHVLGSRTWRAVAATGRTPSGRCAAQSLRSAVHVHTHDTPGGQLASYVAAWQAGPTPSTRRRAMAEPPASPR